MTKLSATGLPAGFGEARHYHVVHPETGQGFPVKAVRGLVTGETAYDFNAVQAKRWLEDRGFFVADNRKDAALEFQNRIEKALQSNPSDRRNRLKHAPADPTFDMVLAKRFRRNPDVVAERLHLAGGICDDCAKPAPFTAARTGRPFLEVHHVRPLADGGPDTVENTRALCPNCHRKAHHGHQDP